MSINNKQVPHLWAHQSKPKAKGNGAISFNGTVLYSYAEPIGSLVTSPAGETIALLISRSWSITTSAHQSAARGAVSHLTNFTVPNIGRGYSVDGIDHETNLAYLIQTFHDGITASYRKRTFDDWNASRLIETGQSALAYARVFNLPTPDLDVVALVRALEAFHNTDDKIAKRALRQARTDAENAALKAKSDAARATALIKIEAWRNGEVDSIRGAYATDHDGGALIRIRGDELQTSRGASVPLTHAIRVFKRLLASREAGIEWRRNGEEIRVGHFQVDRIEKDGSFVAGCHRFNWPEIERAAHQLNLLEKETA